MLQMKNQFLMPPIKTGYCDKEGFVTDKFINFYKRRSEYLGAVTPEPLCIDRSVRELPAQICIDADDKIEGLSRLVSEIHKYETKAVAHLNHPGRMANPKIPGNVFYSSTDKACENGGAKPERMDGNDMDDAVSLFTAAAKRAEKAGFDAVELQFGHGYLLSQFLSPAVNDRKDEYGGSFENRIKFPVRVFCAVINAVNLPIIARISAEEMIPGGLNTSEMIRLAMLLEKKGASAVHVSLGTICSSPPWFFQHMFVPKGKSWQAAAEIKKHLNIPVIFVGKINRFEDINKLKKEFSSDFLAIGRALLADPDFVGKYLGKVKGSPRPCMACSDGCLGGVKSGKGLQCVVNPELGSETHYPGKTASPLNIAVVGGGLAGMEAALTLYKRGHSVDLYEMDELGGQFNLAHLPPKKDSLKLIVDYYKQEFSNTDIRILKKEANEETLLNGGYDKVFLATGAVPAIPPIEGLKDYYWAEVLQPHNIPHGKNFLVIGGGLIGIETASMLVDNDNKATVVEMLDEAARGMEMIEKKLTMKKLKEKGVKILLNTKVSRIEDKTCFLEGSHETKIEDIDQIVIAVGMKSRKDLAEKLQGKDDFEVIGDAKSPGKAIDAIRDARFSTMNL